MSGSRHLRAASNLSWGGFHEQGASSGGRCIGDVITNVDGIPGCGLAAVRTLLETRVGAGVEEDVMRTP